MQCPELLIGGAEYFAVLTAIVGCVMRVVKRIRWLPSDATPIIAAFLGFAIDAVVSTQFCGRPVLAGLAGIMAGLAAAGGHEALARLLKAATGSRVVGDIILGRAKTERDRRG